MSRLTKKSATVRIPAKILRGKYTNGKGLYDAVALVYLAFGIAPEEIMEGALGSAAQELSGKIHKLLGSGWNSALSATNDRLESDKLRQINLIQWCEDNNIKWEYA